MKNVLTSLAKSISKKLPSDLEKQATLIISNEEMNDTMKMVKLLEESGLLIKGVSETVEIESKRTKWRISQYVVRNIKC